MKQEYEKPELIVYEDLSEITTGLTQISNGGDDGNDEVGNS